MTFWHRIIWWFWPPTIDDLLVLASRHGKVTINQVDGVNGIEWMVSLRPRPTLSSKASGVHSHRPHQYAWSFSAHSIVEAVEGVIKEAEDNPMRNIEDGPFRPKLNGAEFDPE